VDVIGEGLLAALMRRLLGDRIQPNSASAIIDTTGSPELIAQATVNLPRRGALLLAAPTRADDAMMRTYADIHVKGLSLIGVRWSGSPPDAPRDLMDFALENLVDVNKPEALLHGLWYRLERR
jgi:D-arabinose 1-dehydrogenase-like Zn-dependent alcohol dehydrogenase